MLSEMRTRPTKSRHSCLGLSVLEVLIILAALAVVVLVSVPGTSILLQNHRLKNVENTLLTSLELARMEAQARSSTVVICPSSNGNSCRRDHDWNYGWLVFSDGNGNGTAQDIELIQAFAAPHERIRVEAVGAARKRVSLTTTGLVGVGEFQEGSFRICTANSNEAQKVLQVEMDGWVRRIQPQNESCGNS